MSDRATEPPQPMCPHGRTGRVFGWLMDVLNRGTHKFALRRLAVQRTDSILEIGFGTGQLAKMFARKARKGFVAGVDPSELMVDTARRRTRRYVRKEIVDLRLGDAARLPWPDKRFDKAAALHCFQFWSDPERGMSEVARVLRSGGIFLLVLRAHKARDHTWLPNPASRAGRELEWLLENLPGFGFSNVRLEGKTGSSAIVTAVKT